eukprot:363786-Chlamydomonas_euryale.AAC.7
MAAAPVAWQGLETKRVTTAPHLAAYARRRNRKAALLAAPSPPRRPHERQTRRILPEIRTLVRGVSIAERATRRRTCLLPRTAAVRCIGAVCSSLAANPPAEPRHGCVPLCICRLRTLVSAGDRSARRHAASPSQHCMVQKQCMGGTERVERMDVMHYIGSKSCMDDKDRLRLTESADCLRRINCMHSVGDLARGAEGPPGSVLHVAEEVARALELGRPVVALESTIVSHGAQLGGSVGVGCCHVQLIWLHHSGSFVLECWKTGIPGEGASGG